MILKYSTLRLWVVSEIYLFIFKHSGVSEIYRKLEVVAIWIVIRLNNILKYFSTVTLCLFNALH